MNESIQSRLGASRTRSRSILMLLIVFVFVLMPLGSAADETTDRLKRMVEERVPGIEVERVQASAVPGIYEAGVGGEAIYVTTDGRYLFRGKLYDLELRQDLTEPFLAKIRMRSLAQVPLERMIIFPAKGRTKHIVTTFTDIDCPFCRRLHSEMDEINAYGIQVRYLLSPGAGLNSNSYRKAVSVWCADNPQQEMNLAKAGVDPEPRECANPVKEHMKLAENFGITGTPMTITDTGEKIIGYLPPRELLERLEAAKAARNP